jgi:hypothetical protein
MLEPQFYPHNGSTVIGQIDANSSGSSQDSSILIERWESKLLEAALADSGSSKSSDLHRLPHVPGFECIGWLGSGSSGDVWLADDLKADRTVALKIMHHRGMHGESSDLFQREFRLLARMRHPNLVVLYGGAVTSDGRQTLAMEWIDGLSLDEWLDVQPALSLECKIKLFRGIVAGVAYLHDHGVIHRDLKPANVIVDTMGVPRIVDFGLARRLHQEGAVESSGGDRIGVAGTLHFMAPEQAADSDGAGAMPVDVFALGVILHRILTGSWLRPPDKTPSEILALVLNPPPLRLPEAARRLPLDLQAILRRALATDPALRYRHARDLESDLQNFTAKLPVSARRHTLTYLTITLLRRQARRSALAAALVIAGLSAGGMIYQRHRAVALKNEANLRHAYALASFTLGQLRKELRGAAPQIGSALPDADELPPDTQVSILPVNPSGQLDLRYIQAQLADLRSAILEGRSQHASALTSISSALDLYCELSHESPDDPKRLLDAARTRLCFARLISRGGRDQLAGVESQKAIDQLERLAGLPGVVSADLLPLRCDAARLLARQIHRSGERASAQDLIVEMIELSKNSPAVLQVCPEDGVSPRLAMAAADFGMYAVLENPHSVTNAKTMVGEVIGILRREFDRNPDSFSMASGIARCLHALAMINLRCGHHEELNVLYSEAAALLIDRPSGAKHLSSGLILEISKSATEWAGKVLNDPNPSVPESAIKSALKFSAHLRRSGFEQEAVLFQRARIYLYQSQLACRTADRSKGARLISKAMEILRYRNFLRRDDTETVLLTAQVICQAKRLSDLPEANWNDGSEKQFKRVLAEIDRIRDQFSPDQRLELESISAND